MRLGVYVGVGDEEINEVTAHILTTTRQENSQCGESSTLLLSKGMDVSG